MPGCYLWANGADKILILKDPIFNTCKLFTGFQPYGELCTVSVISLALIIAVFVGKIPPSFWKGGIAM